MIELAEARGIDIVERRIQPEELAHAQEIFVTGTAAEVTPVGGIDEQSYTVGDVTQGLMEDYDKLVGKPPADAVSVA